ncbi:MAG: hypothetical protein WDO14_15650 [Bacteroidota bacterium]
MKKRLAILSVVILLTACNGSHYTLNDFKDVKKVDTHFHFDAEDSVLINLAKEDNFVLLTINVDAPRACFHR